MIDFLKELALHIREEIHAYSDSGQQRSVDGVSPGGDAQFDIDHVAESAAANFLTSNRPCDLAVYSEDDGMVVYGEKPEKLLIIDPIDGTRPASAGLEMSMVSIACAPHKGDETAIADVEAGVLCEIKSGELIYADDAGKPKSSQAGELTLAKAPCTNLDEMFWSFELNGHPMHLMTNAYGHIVDSSANTGGLFIFNSATYSISRIITGQLDAYVDIGNRVLKEHPETEAEFLRVGKGSILHLFPYDIAAAVFIAEKAGIKVTDAFGESLLSTRLTDISPENQKSCIAAGSPELHEQILASVNW